MTQLAIFDFNEPQIVPKVADIAVVYTCAQSAKTSNVRMFMSVNDAMTLCSDDSSQGAAHNSRWMAMWTTLDRLLSALGSNPTIPVEDDGRFLPACRRLGITPISITDDRVSEWVRR